MTAVSDGEKRRLADSPDWPDRILSIISSLLSIAVSLGMLKESSEASTKPEKLILILGFALFLGLTIQNLNLRKKWKAQAAQVTEAAEHAAALARNREELANELISKNADLKWKTKALEEKEESLAKTKRNTLKLFQKANILEEAFLNKIPREIGYYIISKKKYDDFKTELQLQECTLEVRLKKLEESKTGYKMLFRWILVVKNDCPKPTKTVHFIFSGDKDMYKDMHEDLKKDVLAVTVRSGSAEITADYSVTLDKSTDDDSFLEITLPAPIEPKTTETITINYAPKHGLPQSNATIWLAPDALGFAKVSKFCIRVFHDGEIVIPKGPDHEETKCFLNTYRLSTKISSHRHPIWQSTLGTDTVFQYSRGEGDDNLQKCIYIMELINDPDGPPPNSQDKQSSSDDTQAQK